MKIVFFCTGLIFLMFLNCQSHKTEIMEEKQKEEKIDSMEIVQQALEKNLLNNVFLQRKKTASITFI